MASESIKSVGSSVVANLVYSGSLALVLLVMPKIASIEDYASFQSYVLYVFYGGYVSWGLTEGILLRYRTRRWDSLSTSDVSSTMVSLLVLNGVVLAVVALISWMSSASGWFVYAIGLSSFIYVLRTLLSSFLLSTGRIQEWSISLVVERIWLIAGLCVVLVFANADPLILVAFDIFGRLVSLAYVCVLFRAPLRHLLSDSRQIFGSATAIAVLGFPLLISNVSAMFAPGVVRIFIELHSGVNIFAQFALAFSIVGLVQVLINSVSNALFPTLSKSDSDAVSRFVNRGRRFSYFLVPACAAFVVLFAFFVPVWLPEYVLTGVFLISLLPFLVFEILSRGLLGPLVISQHLERVASVINSVAIGLVLCVVFVSLVVGLPVLVPVFGLGLAVTFRYFALSAKVSWSLPSDRRGSWFILGCWGLLVSAAAMLLIYLNVDFSSTIRV